MTDIFTHVSGVKGRWERRSDPWGERSDPRLSLFLSAFDRTAEWVVAAQPRAEDPCRVCRKSEDEEPDADCVNCLGTGYSVALRKLRAVAAHEGVGQLVSATLQRLFHGLSAAGVVDPGARLYITLPQDALRPDDYIIEVEWDLGPERVRKEGSAVGIDGLYKIVYSQSPLYKGKVLYNVSWAIEANFVVEKLDLRLREFFGRLSGERDAWTPILVGSV